MLSEPVTSLQNPRSKWAEYLRGKNVYNGGSYAAHQGPQPFNGEMGRPPADPMEALLRRLRGNFAANNQTSQPIGPAGPTGY